MIIVWFPRRQTIVTLLTEQLGLVQGASKPQLARERGDHYAA